MATLTGTYRYRAVRTDATQSPVRRYTPYRGVPGTTYRLRLAVIHRGGTPVDKCCFSGCAKCPYGGMPMAKRKSAGQIRSLVRHTAPGDVIELALVRETQGRTSAHSGVYCVMGIGPLEGRWVREADRRTGQHDNTRGPYWVPPDQQVLAVYLKADGRCVQDGEPGDTDPVRGE